MSFNFNNVECQGSAADDVSIFLIYADFTDAFAEVEEGKFDEKIVEKKGYLWNDESNPFYILKIDRYLKSLIPLASFRLAYKYKDMAVIVVSSESSADDEVDLSAFEGLPIEYMPILVFQHHNGPMKGMWNGVEVTIDEDFQRSNHCLNDTVVFKGVYKAVTAGEHKYKLEKVWDRFYYNL